MAELSQTLVMELDVTEALGAASALHLDLLDDPPDEAPEDAASLRDYGTAATGPQLAEAVPPAAGVAAAIDSADDVRASTVALAPAEGAGAGTAPLTAPQRVFVEPDPAVVLGLSSGGAGAPTSQRDLPPASMPDPGPPDSEAMPIRRAHAAPLERAPTNLSGEGWAATLRGTLAPLLEIRLVAGGTLTVPEAAVLWRAGELCLDRLDAAGLVQARGPGRLAVSPGAASGVYELALDAGTAVDVRLDALLALPRGALPVVCSGPPAARALRVRARRPLTLLLRSAGTPYLLDLQPGQLSFVASAAVLCLDATVSVARVTSHAGAATLLEYRLCGAGRAVLCAYPAGIVA